MSTVLFNFMQDAFAGCSVDTCDLESNIYTEKIKPKRIDFIFFSDERCPKAEMEVQSKTLAVTGTIPGKEFPYSDHEGVEVVFRLKERTTPLVVSEQPLGGTCTELYCIRHNHLQTGGYPVLICCPHYCR